MAINLFNKYGSRANPPSIDYPEGSIKNRSAPDVKDGTPLDADWANDHQGFFQSILSYFGVTANGTPDKVGASQYFDALMSDPTEARRGMPLVSSTAEIKAGSVSGKMVSPSGLKAFGSDSSMVVFSAAGTSTFTVPDILRSGAKKPYVIVVGAGGGCPSFASTLSRGAAGGGSAEGIVDLTGVSSVAVTVGGGSVGVPGGTSSFGSYMSATGGAAGAIGAGEFSEPGNGVGGEFNRRGGQGGGPDSTYSGEGGSSPYSTQVPRSNSGLSGSWPGGGAGAGNQAQPGANGAVIIRW